MSAPVLSNFAKKTNLTVNTTNCGSAGGVIQLSLGSADIAPLLASGFDIVPFLADGVTIPTFTRISYSASPAPSAQLYVTLPTGSTGAGNNYPLTIASGYASATDQSTAIVKGGPYTSGPFSNNVVSYYPMLAADTSTTSCPDAFAHNGVTGSQAANPLVLTGNPTRGASICKIPGTSIACPGTSITFNGTTQWAETTNPVIDPFMQTGSEITFSMWFTFNVTSFANNPAILWAPTGTTLSSIGISSAGILSFKLFNGTTLSGTTALVISTTYDFLLVMNPSGTTIYINGAVYAAGPPQKNGLQGGSSNTGANFFFFTNSSGTKHPVPGTIDNIGWASESYAPEDVAAMFNQAMPPIALTPKRKLTRIGSGATQGKLISPPVSGWGSIFGWAEFCPLYNPNGLPGIAGNPKWAATLTGEQLQATQGVGLAVCSGDPKVPANWTVQTVPLIGNGGAGDVSGIGGIAAMSFTIYDPSQKLWIITYGHGYDGAAVYATTTPDFVHFTSPVTLLTASALSITTPDVTTCNGLFNRSIVPMSGGGWLMIIEATFVDASTSFTTIAFTSPNLIGGGTWTYNSTISVALMGMAPGGLFGDININSPGVFQSQGKTYIIENVLGQFYSLGWVTDATNFTTITPLSAPFMEINMPYENTSNAGIADPRIIDDGSTSYHFFTDNSNLAPGYIELATYPGTMAQLFATGTVGMTALASLLPSSILAYDNKGGAVGIQSATVIEAYNGNTGGLVAIPVPAIG